MTLISIRPKRIAALATISLSAILASSLASSVASAADAETMRITASYSGESVTVSVPTASLETEEGTMALYKALARKAEASCKRTIPVRTGKHVSLRRCMPRLLNSFVKEIDHERMTRLHELESV